ncbi:ABC transporter ATP-binding protein [Dinghuibacter silviterrae]|uniref:Iron(III) transport system ATP-binding protein n=1 Tax=Dinghuibacter silviterrae TaxID=1539049 RepID=A0A4R8DFL8_9BACT|nr:ABC transporter ATP-binding protein [Dinghuibacter silviterrae]TDW96403.1 iron(III) transport system ATP-binding protein [Dinghuibacter silviterrae]
MKFLTVTDIRKTEGSLTVVQDVRFSQQEHERLAIVGESGSGKSTLLKMIAGYTQPDAGQVLFLDKRVLGPDEQLIMGHPGIAYLSQHFELRNNYRVEEVLAYANQLPDEAAQKIFDICRITPFLKRKTHQVSGGEKQRIALARLLVGAPRLLLLDEPYSNLDLIHKGILKTVVQDIGEQLGLTVLLVSHDPMDTLPWADRILVMRGGVIVQTGTPEEVYRCPANEYVGGLFGDYNLIPDADGRRRFLRPADLQINGQGIPGTVTRVAYLGDSFDVTVSTGSGPLTVNTRETGVSAGDKVYLAPAPGEAWYL